MPNIRHHAEFIGSVTRGYRIRIALLAMLGLAGVAAALSLYG